MKILYVSHNAQFYGAPKSLLEYIVKIKERGIEPIVVVPKRDRLKKELNKLGIRTEIIPYQNCVYKGAYSFAHYLAYVNANYPAVLRICKLIIKEKIDIVHTNTMAVNVGALAAYLTRTPHIWHFREHLEEHFGLKLWNPFITKKLIRYSRCCIAISEGIKRKYADRYGVHIIRLYNGIDKNAYYHCIDPDESGRKSNELLIAGRISEEKGQWDAVRAVEVLVNRGISVHLNVVGGGNTAWKNSIKRYIRDKGLTDYITIHPYTDDLQTMKINSRMILVCARMEAFGRVTVETMLAGRIVIGADSGGTLELIGKDEERGYLYQGGHPEKHADKIQYVLENQDEVLRKEREAQKFAIELTDLERYTTSLIQIYRKLVKGKGRGVNDLWRK